MVESLESRQMCSTSAAPADVKHLLHETVGSAFTANLGETTPLLYATPQAVVKNSSTAAVHSIIHWGDGTTSAGRVVTSSNGTVKVVGSHAYARTGRYHIVVFSSRYISGNGPIPEVFPDFVQHYDTIRDVAEVSAAN